MVGPQNDQRSLSRQERARRPVGRPWYNRSVNEHTAALKHGPKHAGVVSLALGVGAWGTIGVEAVLLLDIARDGAPKGFVDYLPMLALSFAVLVMTIASVVFGVLGRNSPTQRRLAMAGLVLSGTVVGLLLVGQLLASGG